MIINLSLIIIGTLLLINSIISIYRHRFRNQFQPIRSILAIMGVGCILIGIGAASGKLTPTLSNHVGNLQPTRQSRQQY